MNAAATDFSCTLMRFGFGAIEPLSVGHPWRCVHQQAQNPEAESQERLDGVHRFRSLRSVQRP